MAKLWAGRFSKTTDETVNDFNSSIPFDNRLYAQDIRGSLAHSDMLARQGIITREDRDAIHQGLTEILAAMDAGEIDFDPAQYEDIHMCVEQLLTEKIGDAGKRLHTGRSRNDQVALDMRMYVREEAGHIHDQVLHLIDVITDVAQNNTETIMPGYTHLQRAQPVTFAYILLAYVSMLKRDARRLENTLEVLDECPLGSGALAGTTYPLDRHFTAETLGFSRPCDNAMDGVSDRDYCLEFLSDLSILMMHLSRLSEEVISWCSWEFKFIELDDAFSTGSSIMPQKKNPDICELVRGKTGRVYGDLMTLLTVMKGLPLAYDKDMQEDKECVFDAIDTVSMCLKVLPDMLSTMTVLTENMAAAGRRGFINATDCADYLTKKGMPFRDAYKLTGGLVARCIREGRTLEQLSLEELQEESPLFDEGFYAAVDLLNAVKRRNTWGGPSPEQTQEQIAQAREFVKNHRKQD